MLFLSPLCSYRKSSDYYYLLKVLTSLALIRWGKQGKEWTDLPPALQKVFLSQLSAVIHDMKGPYWFVACVQGLGMMRCPWRLIEEIPNFSQFMQVFEEYLPQLSNLDLGSLLFQ